MEGGPTSPEREATPPARLPVRHSLDSLQYFSSAKIARNRQSTGGGSLRALPDESARAAIVVRREKQRTNGGLFSFRDALENRETPQRFEGGSGFEPLLRFLCNGSVRTVQKCPRRTFRALAGCISSATRSGPSMTGAAFCCFQILCRLGTTRADQVASLAWATCGFSPAVSGAASASKVRCFFSSPSIFTPTFT